MLRAMARLSGDDPGKRVGNSYSHHNRTKLKARAEEAAAMGLTPLDPLEQHELARKMEAGYTTISERAVRVPKVGQRTFGERPARVARENQIVFSRFLRLMERQDNEY